MQHSDSSKIFVGTKKLVHYSLCPHSRFIRLILSEKKVDYALIEEQYWEARQNFLVLNPSGSVPVLIEPDHKTIIRDVDPVFGYIEETIGDRELVMMSDDVIKRAEIRRLLSWFNIKFYNDISNALLTERVLKRMTRNGYPCSVTLRKALQLLPEHIVYMAYLLENRDWLAGNKISAADFCAAAHLSVVDFLGNISWAHQQYKSEFNTVREWYARMKSRKSFRDLTDDVIKGFTPPEHYANPDF